MKDFSRILVPVDFSECSRAALGCALLLAKKFGARLELLHVWEPPVYVTPETPVFLSGPGTRSFEEVIREHAAGQLAQMRASLDAEPAVRVSSHLVSGLPAQAIVSFAAEHLCDLIVLGTHGRTGLAHWLMGSVAERVARHARCPVLVVPRPAAPPLAPSGLEGGKARPATRSG